MKRTTSPILLRLALLVALVALSFGARADAEAIVVRNAWARATVPGQPVGAAYLEITSPVEAAVVELGSEAAEVTELHHMEHTGDIMRMRRVERLALPAGRAVKLLPGGTHVMLIGLRRPLRSGDSVALRLTVAGPAGTQRKIRVDVPVRAVAAGGAAR